MTRLPSAPPTTPGVPDPMIDDLFRVVRIIHRKLLKFTFEGENREVTRPHLGIMVTLEQAGPLPVSEIGKRLIIPKPQMTRLIDRLIALGIVERLPDAHDRRITRVRLTEQGRRALAECIEIMRANVRQKLSTLDAGELAEWSAALSRLSEIGEKLG